MTRIMKPFLMTLFIVLLLAGCGGGSETETGGEQTEAPQAGGKLNIAINAQPPTLDPHVTTATATSEVGRNIFETLVTVNAGYKPVPMLTENVEQSEDGKTFTFHLRKGVKFHNGKEMKAEDVVASMNKWVTISTRGKTVLNGAAFEATDEYTVVLTIPNPVVGVLDTIAGAAQFAAIMPKEIVEAAGPEGVKEYVGTGPFRFTEWKQDQYIHLTKFDEYSALETPASGLAGKKEALVDEIFFHIVTDGSTRLAGVQTGEYDGATWLPRDNYAMLQSLPNVKTSIDIYGGHYIFFNKKEGVLSDVRMRQAVNAALDMDQIMLGTFSSEEFYRLDHGYMLQEQVDWYSEAGKELYNEKDVEKAKRLMQEAGYNGEEIRILTSRDYDHVYNASVVVKDQLEKIGMKVKLEVLDWATLVDKRSKPGEYEAFVTGMPLFSTPTQIVSLNPNFAGWTEDPKIAELMAKISATPTIEEAKPLWDELQGYSYEYLPMTKFGDFYLLNAFSDKVEGNSFLEGLILWNTTKNK
ncbi:ABC transporter substrate-binding protein [Ammoniphilus sp. YIM 78166]|uniref:ABC transporter substrate-binding protein n=1 Tax=Ammoniphilus sp. YIM 78166 TaxID=1644106 RepID=UPI00106F154E|nr:ABC transporter substrate-binding protein [Ammoniphilus sp. YIM 78166]